MRPFLTPSSWIITGRCRCRKSLGTVTVPEATLLVISPFTRSGLRLRDKANPDYPTGADPTNDGKVCACRAVATEERRTDSFKHLNKCGESPHRAVRNSSLRDVKDTIEQLEKKRNQPV